VAFIAFSSSRWDGGSASEPVAAGAPSVTVVVAAADLPAGAVVDSAMLTTTALPAGAARGLVPEAAAVSGRTLLVAVLKGEPISVGMTAARPAAAAGRRLLRVSLGVVDVAPDVTVGGDADLVASFPPAAPGQKASVSVVATVRVASLEGQLDTAAAPSTPDPVALGSGAPQVGSTTAVTLDCASADALRVLWARDNARILRLLAHPQGDPSLPPSAAAA
jgi:Flp pilus assembly protein CpaB